MQNRKTFTEILLLRQERKNFLHRVITGDEDWIYFESPKCKKSSLLFNEASTPTAQESLVRSKKNCVLWASGRNCQCILLPTTTCLYKSSIAQKRQKWYNRYNWFYSTITLRANYWDMVQDTIQVLKWDLLFIRRIHQTCSFWLLFFPIDGVCLHWTTLIRFQRSSKLVECMVSVQRRVILPQRWQRFVSGERRSISYSFLFVFPLRFSIFAR